MVNDMSQYSRSLVGEFGEPVRLERFAGTAMEGGYSSREYHDAEEAYVVLRPGDIDVPFTDTLGDHGSNDLWCIAASSLGLGEKDQVTRLRPFGDGGFGDGHFGAGSTYEVSMPRYDRVNGVVVHQLDEADSRR